MKLGPLITIGITCFNEGDWLLECWRSVLDQTDDRWTAILVMDGTTHQRTREIFEQLEHPKLRKFAMPSNMGPYPTRNKAFELTKTPYHFYLDGDDQLLPEAVALALKTFTQYPDAGYVYGDYEYIGNRCGIQSFPNTITPDDFIEKQPTPGACVYKKQTWEYLGGCAPELARGNGDYDFLISATEAGIKGYHCGEVFYRYRVGQPNKVSNSYGRRYYETHEIMVRRHPRFFSNRQHRNRFLAIGYRRAAWENRKVGDIKQASKLAWLAIVCGMRKDRGLWNLNLEGRLSPWFYHFLLNTWHLGRRVLGLIQKRGK